ncbi:MAG: hypothetical protein CVU47_12100 [Chloroflexi bacterium HGW-Chloroflexi-9]|nr:MAG: hypothetical protein CVU47_12100 [Chloroflexi bacterium HGW-Chloroflexi-9]
MPFAMLARYGAPWWIALAGVVVFLAFAVFLVTTDEDDDEYPPFVMEMEVTHSDPTVPVTREELDWNSYADWTYRIFDTEGTLLGESGNNPDIDGRHIPGVWFRPIGSWRGNPSPTYSQVSEYVWQQVYMRDCTEISNWDERHRRLPETFCETREDTFEDRTVAEFDPESEIPVRHTVYLDGVLVSDRRAVTLEMK